MRFFLYYCLILFFIFIHLTQYAHSAAVVHDIDISGYVKPLFSLTDFKNLDLRNRGRNAVTSETATAFTTNLRTNLNWQINRKTHAEIAYEITPGAEDPDRPLSLGSISASDPLSYRVYDTGKRMGVFRDGSDFAIQQNLDRLVFTLSPDYADFYIGRQPIAFGSARVINPTDIITSFTYNDLNQEERSGVDAIRIKIPVFALNEIDLGVIFSDDFSLKHGATFFRGRFSVGNMDITPLAITFNQNFLLGIDFASSVRDAGVWIEGAQVFANILDDHITDQDYFRLSAGMDYSFSEYLYAYVEYHYNGAGKDNAGEYQRLIFGMDNNIAYTEGAVYLLGRHYIAPGISYQATPLTTLSAQAILNANDGSLLLFPEIQYSMSDNSVLEAGAFIGFGGKSEIISDTDTGFIALSTTGEFSLYPSTYFISAKFYY